jgi:hypothetical protein
MRSVLKPLALAVLLSTSTASFADLVTFEATDPGVGRSSFSIVFDSADNELLFSEIVPASFSGMTVTIPFAIFYDVLTHIPALAAASVHGIGDYFLTAGGPGLPGQSGCTVSQWCFAQAAGTSIDNVTGGWGRYEVTSVAVPEPGTMALVCLAMAGLGLTRRRSPNGRYR